MEEVGGAAYHTTFAQTLRAKELVSAAASPNPRVVPKVNLWLRYSCGNFVPLTPSRVNRSLMYDKLLFGVEKKRF